MNYWLIRVDNRVALIWKRKYLLGLIAIPWSLHGGTDIMRTITTDHTPLQLAFKYIIEQTDPKELVDVKVIML